MLMLPVGASLAVGRGGHPPLLFIYGMVFVASQSFLSPIGYQTNLMVFAPGNYRIRNFLHFGWASFSRTRFWSPDSCRLSARCF